MQLKWEEVGFPNRRFDTDAVVSVVIFIKKLSGKGRGKGCPSVGRMTAVP